MLEFDERRTEVNGLVADFIVKSELWVGEQPEAERQAASAKAKKEQEAFKANVPDYFDARDEILTNLVTTMSEAFVTSGDPEVRWRTVVEGLAKVAELTLGSILKDITDPTGPAKAAQWAFAEYEKLFNKGLADVGIATNWKVLALLHEDIDNMVLTLDKEWGLLTTKAHDIHSMATAAITKLLDALPQGTATGEAELAQLKTAAHETKLVLDDFFVVADIGDNWKHSSSSLLEQAEAAFARYDKALDAVAAVTTTWRRAIEEAKFNIAALKGFRSWEEALHDAFRLRRREAKSYLDEPPPTQAERVADGMESTFTNWSGSLSNQAQRLDANALLAELVKQTDAYKALIEDRFKEFSTKFGGRFVGSINDDTVNQLAHSREWADFRSRFTARRDPDTLRSLAPQLEAINVDADGLIKGLESAVNRGRNDKTSDREAGASLASSLRSEVLPKFQAGRKELRRVCDDGVALLEGPDLASVLLGRESLESALRSA